MKYDKVYVVINEDKVVYASIDEKFASEYSDDQNYVARKRILSEMGNDDPTDEDIAEVDFLAGFGGDYYEVVEVDISNSTEDDMIVLPDGIEIEVAEILEKLEATDEA